jgi:hypothetical protein
MTTEQEIFEKYYKKGARDLQGFFSDHSQKDNDLASKGFDEAMGDLKSAIHEAYEAGKADGVYLLDKALAIDSTKLSEAYEQQLRDAYKERKSHAPSVYDEAERQVLGEIIDIKGMSKEEMLSRIKNPKQKVMTTMGSMYNILQDMVKDSNKAIFAELESYMKEQRYGWGNGNSYTIQISKGNFEALKAKYLKAKP